MSKSHGSDHMDDMVEWGQKQYTPWEYAQEGKLPPHLKAEGNKKWAAIAFFVQGIICTLITILILLNDQSHEERWLESLIPALIAVLYFFVAANYIKQWKAAKLKTEKSRTHRKKR